ncbi:trm112p-like protein isoform X7 [Tasmannia lanceolata]|uniref:trm112p-like protein isoform X7 n=1 Tax=Tasmannia lanceolata TaxID=3420 RepID=UPI0040631F77
MVRGSRALLKAFSELLVCPLSKQPLRLSQDSNSLISDTLGVSYPIVDGIPCLVPKDGKLVDTHDTSTSDNTSDSSPG